MRKCFRLWLFVTLAAVSLHAQQLVFTHLAGSTGGGGYDDGAGSAARFQYPAGVAVDRNGNVYVADTKNAEIRKISPNGNVTSLAGTPEATGSADGVGSMARFNRPNGIAVDAAGNLYVADTFNSTIRKITPAGVVTTVAGLAGQSGHADGKGSDARFDYPEGVTVDAAGNLYIADTDNSMIRKITPAGVVTTLAGRWPYVGPNDGTGSDATFDTPEAIAVDAAGNVYVADTDDFIIRKVTPAGVVTTIAGKGRTPGKSDGNGSAARFDSPTGIALDNAGNIYVADTANNTVRKITPAGDVSTLAGTPGTFGSTDATGSAARFTTPAGVAVDASGNIYVADLNNSTVRKITPLGVVTTLAGAAPEFGTNDGNGSAARFAFPRQIAADRVGNVYVADTGYSTIRKISTSGDVTTIAGTAGSTGTTDGIGSAARFNAPRGVAVDPAGNVYVADTGNHTIRKITTGGAVSTLAGTAAVRGSSDGIGPTARFDNPSGLALDSAGNVYVADTGNSSVRKVTPAGVVTTLSNDFDEPRGIAVDRNGNVFVADTADFTIDKINSSGLVTVVAGRSRRDGSDDGVGSDARFSGPRGLALDGLDDIYVADSGNSTIRKIAPDGTVTTIAGMVDATASTDGIGTAARFDNPAGLAFDGSGNLYVSDTFNNAIRVGRVPLPDVATIDSPFVAVGAVRQLDSAPRTATSWQWSVVRRPAGSTAVLSSATARNPTFIPDVADLYIFRLVATNASGTSITTVSLGPVSGRRRTRR